MHLGEAIVVVAATTSLLRVNVRSAKLGTSPPEMPTSSVNPKSRSDLVHCEITFRASDRKSGTQLTSSATPMYISGPGCDDPHTVTSLTLTINDNNDVDLLPVDLFPVCQFAGLERITMVGPFRNESMTPLSCFPKIRHVVLRRADLGTIQRSLISADFRLRDIRSIDVSDSGVEDISSGAFDGRRMNCLEQVDLAMNSLTELVNASFVNLVTLTTLNLSHNSIRYIFPYAFVNVDLRDDAKVGLEAWSKLDMIDLSHNDLGVIESQLFNGPIKSVRKLLLQHNHLSRLPRNIFDRLKQLALINLAYNEIIWLDVGAFSSTSLRQVDLSHNALRKLISMTFLYVPAVQMIDLSYNQINQVYKYAFYRICKDSHVRVVASDNASDSEAGRRHVTISLRANQLENDVIYQVIVMYRQQRRAAGGGRGCWMNVDLGENRISHLLDDNAATALARYDPRNDNGVLSAGSVEINLAANDLRCDCTLVKNIELLEKIAGGAGSWLGPSNMADWRQLACSAAETGPRDGGTVAEFVDKSNCTSDRRSVMSTGSNQRDHVTGKAADLIPELDQRRRKFGAANDQKPEVDGRSGGSGDTQSTVKYLPPESHLPRHLSSTGGSAALIALVLCAGMLALVGGLLLCRAGVRRSRGVGGGRIRQGRRKRDLFIVYANDDEAWVTGTLLDVIFSRHPGYDVILLQHLHQTCDTYVTARKWNSYEQMVFGSVIDHSTMTIVVLSGNFLRTVWSSVDFRSLLVGKVDSQRHRFLFIFLDNDVMRDAVDLDIPDDRKQLYDCAAAHGRLAAAERNFAERLCDYLLPPNGPQEGDSLASDGPQVDQSSVDCFDSDESMALIGSCRHQRY